MSTIQSEAKHAAERLLDELWGDTFPVDPVQIARRLGLRVIDAQLDPEVSGALVKEAGQDPAILINTFDGRSRQRFSCAHEIGHYVRRSEDIDQYQYIDYRDRTSSRGTESEEIFANTFAACLLMPEDAVRELHRQELTDLDMSLRFGVSREAMQLRLKNLKLL